MADSTQKPKKERNYVKGGAKTVSFNNGSELVNLDLKIEGKIIGSKGDILPNEAGYAKIVISKLDTPDKYGNSHIVYENDFKPDPNMANKPRKTATVAPSTDTGLPWDD